MKRVVLLAVLLNLLSVGSPMANTGRHWTIAGVSLGEKHTDIAHRLKRSGERWTFKNAPPLFIFWLRDTTAVSVVFDKNDNAAWIEGFQLELNESAVLKVPESSAADLLDRLGSPDQYEKRRWPIKSNTASILTYKRFGIIVEVWQGQIQTLTLCNTAGPWRPRFVPE